MRPKRMRSRACESSVPKTSQHFERTKKKKKKIVDLTGVCWEVVKSENADRDMAGNFSWHLMGNVGHVQCCSAAIASSSFSMAAIELITLYARLANALHKMAPSSSSVLLRLSHRKDSSVALEEPKSSIPAIHWPPSSLVAANNEEKSALYTESSVCEWWKITPKMVEKRRQEVFL